MLRYAGFSRLNNSGQPAPSCLVTVWAKGTNQLASLYLANSLSQPGPNPFSAGTDGSFYFYAGNGRYDVQFSGGGIVSPWTYGDVALYDPGNIGS